WHSCFGKYYGIKIGITGPFRGSVTQCSAFRSRHTHSISCSQQYSFRHWESRSVLVEISYAVRIRISVLVKESSPCRIGNITNLGTLRTNQYFSYQLLYCVGSIIRNYVWQWCPHTKFKRSCAVKRTCKYPYFIGLPNYQIFEGYRHIIVIAQYQFGVC